MTEKYRGHRLHGDTVQRTDGRWAVAVLVDDRHFTAEDKIGYILEVEAEKECLNLGRRLVDLSRA